MHFFALLGLSAIVGGVIVLAVGGFIANNISDQNLRNTFIKTENTKLDTQIQEIATLKQEIDALKARQQAVEDLQSDRNQPVYLMDELVKQVPEGIYLKALKQSGQRIVLNGYAQSNERVSELLRNLSNNSTWLERPDLVGNPCRAARGKVGMRRKSSISPSMSASNDRVIRGDPAAAGRNRQKCSQRLSRRKTLR